MNKKTFAFLATVILLNTACTPKQEAAPNSTSASSAAVTEVAAVTTSSEAIATTEMTTPPVSNFLNTYWKLILLQDTEVSVSDAQREPHLIFNAEKRLAGSDGCNHMMGSYILEGEKLILSEIAGTKMACTEGGEQAQLFIDTLTKVASHSLHSDQLELRDATGLVIARFKAVALP